MASNWKTTKLLDHYDIRSGLSKPAKYFGSGYPFLTFKDVFYNYFTPDRLGDLVQSNDKERASSSVKRGDVFLTRTSETMHELGMSCVALQDYENSTFNGFCKRLRPHKESELVPEYVGYYLRSSKFRQSMLAFSTMSTRASLNNEMIGRLEISYPSKNEQLKIAKILKTLDDKVALNRQINQTLEQMAQALFKSWFVDFDPVVDNALDAGFFEQDLDFPDELLRRAEARRAVREHDDFKQLPDAIRQLFPSAFEECAEPSLGLGGWVPQGWQALQFGEFIHRKSVGKKYDQKSASAVGKIPILDQGKSGVIGYHDDEPGVRASLDSPVVVFANHTCYMRLISFDFSAIQNVLPFTGKDVDTTWAFYATQDRVRFSEYKGHWPDFVIEKTIVPSLVLTTKFREYVDSLIRSVRCNELQNQTLINLRDTLLPKLISGELRLDNIEAGLANEGVA